MVVADVLTSNRVVEDFLNGHSILNKKAVDYTFIEVVSPETHRVLLKDEIDSQDVVLCNMSKQVGNYSGLLEVSVPIHWIKNGNLFWSDCIGGNYLQSLINFQYSPISPNFRFRNAHRSLTQLRELRDFSYVNEDWKKFLSAKSTNDFNLNELVDHWIDSRDHQADRFAQEYTALFGKSGLYELVHG